jgi:hypothetical protein
MDKITNAFPLNGKYCMIYRESTTMADKTVANRTRLAETWQPDHNGRLFATEQGLDPDTLVEEFRDHHIAAGNLMASWSAAWRTWCRNEVKFSRRRAPAPPLLEIIAADDPWGIIAWSHTLRDAEVDTIDGKPVLTVGGFDIVATASEVCSAAEVPQSRRVDLTPIADWLRSGIEPEIMVRAVGTGRRPDRPNLRWYDNRVREQHQRQQGRAA